MPPAEKVFEENRLLKQENEVLRRELAWCRAELFGPGKSETMDRLQATLPLVTPASPAPVKTVAVTYERATPREKRMVPAEVFKDVPVKETVVLDPPEVMAEPEAYELIGEERTFEIDLVPSQLYKREIVRRKYRHKTDRTKPPMIAAAPARPVAGGYASAGLLAWVALSKYQHHLPLHRLSQMSARWGATLPRQTMADWIRIAAEWLEPVYRQMHQRLLSGRYLQVDETPIRCNDPDEKHGGTSDGWMWVVSRPGDDVVFDWRLSRRHGELTSLIAGFRGLLHSDGFGAYESYAKEHPEVTWLTCWAHCRRRYYEAKDDAPKAVHFVLRLIGGLYECEQRWAQLPEAELRRHRQEYYPRKLYWLKKVVTGLRARALPKSGLYKACDYTLRFWTPLVEHLNHGITKLDTNVVENCIRPTKLGAKNWLFVGHPEAGQRSAILYSIIVSCHRRGIDPLAYLRDVLTRLPAMTNQNNLEALVPALWQPRS